jgi:hypothetical protein
MSFSRSVSWLVLAGAGVFASVSAQELDGNFYDGTWTCPTLGIVVKPVDEKTLAGSVAIGTHATESAEVHASHSAVSAPNGGAGAAEAANSIRLQRR